MRKSSGKTVETGTTEIKDRKQSDRRVKRGRCARIDRTAPCETRGRRKSDGGAAAEQRDASRKAVGRLEDGSESRETASRRANGAGDRQPHNPGDFYSLVCQEYLFGQLAVEHLVRVPEAPGHGISDERFPVKKRHIDGWRSSRSQSRRNRRRVCNGTAVSRR